MKRENGNYYSQKIYVRTKLDSKFDDDFFRELEMENKRHQGMLVDESIIEPVKEAEIEKPLETPKQPANIKEEKEEKEPKEEKHYYSIYDEIAERRKKQKAGLGLYKDSTQEKIEEVEKNTIESNEIFSSSHTDTYNADDDSSDVDDYYEPTYSRHKKSRKGLVGLVIVLVAVIVLGVAVSILYFSGALDGLLNDTEQASTSPAVTETASVEEATSTVEENSLLSIDNYIKSTPEDNNQEGEFENNLFLWNDKVFELFYGTQSMADKYSNAINKCANSLGDDVSVYNMVVPSSTEIYLPQRFIENKTVETNDESQFISLIYKNLGDKVTPINCYNYLSSKANEYIYFGGDRNWTGLGGYYGYTAFADSLSLSKLDINTCTKNSVEGYYGALSLGVTAEVPTDTVEYWLLPYTVTNTIYADVKGDAEAGELYYSGATGGAYTYNLFLHDDSTPLCILQSDSSNAKGKILVVKDSLGNAFAPYLTYNYKEVHVIDATNASGEIDLAEYVADNSIEAVLFINSTRTASLDRLIANIEGLVK